MTQRPWTLRDLDALKRYAHLGAREVALLLNRTEQSVRQTAKRHRVSLRRDGSPFGLVLGQPRGVRLEDVPALAAAKKDGLALTPAEAGPLCPLCARYPQDGPAGVCRRCRLAQLADAHREATAVRDAERDLWAARQRKKRGG